MPPGAIHSRLHSDTVVLPGTVSQLLLRMAAGTVSLPESIRMAMPGDNLTVTVELQRPLALHAGLRFALREGGRTVGAGVITRVLA